MPTSPGRPRTRARPATSTSSSTSCCVAGVAAYGADAVATGHYARIEAATGSRWRLLRAADANKDQTYFLWVLTQEQLAATRFPLGRSPRPQVRALAAELGLPTADKPESQEICFVPAGDYRHAARRAAGICGRARTDRRRRRHRIGTHTGYAHYTVGQRHGLGVALGEAVYVREVRPATNTVVIGGADEVAAVAGVGARAPLRGGRAARPSGSRRGPHPPPSAGRGLRGHAGRRRPLRGRDRRAGMGSRARPGSGAVHRRRVPRRRSHRPVDTATAA